MRKELTLERELKREISLHDRVSTVLIASVGTIRESIVRAISKASEEGTLTLSLSMGTLFLVGNQTHFPLPRNK